MNELLEVLLRAVIKLSKEDGEDIFHQAQELAKDITDNNWVPVLPHPYSTAFSIVVSFINKEHQPPSFSYLDVEQVDTDVNKLFDILSHIKQPLRGPEFKKILDQVSKHYQKILLKKSTDKVFEKDSIEEITTGLVKTSLQHKLKSGSISFFVDREVDDTKSEYEKEEKEQPVGILTGFSSKIDLLTNGIQPGELWLDCGFVQELKSTSMMNWAHNAIDYGHNVFFASFEMTPRQCKMVFHTIHAYKMATRLSKESFDYDSLKKRILTQEEREFYFDVVLEDLRKNEELGKMWVERPDRVVSVEDVRRKMMEIENKSGIKFDIAFFDYVKLMKPSERLGQEDPINAAIREMKMFAMTYQGRAIAAVTGFQMNRKGREAAGQADGRYQLNALQQHNAAEQSADVIFANYLDDKLRAIGEDRITLLKNRDGELPKDPCWNVRADLPYRYLGDLEELPTGEIEL